MGGLAVLFIIGLYVWGATKVFKHVKQTWAKVAVLLAAALIPTADALVGRMYLDHLCTEEGGLHVKRVVDNVRGIYAGTADERALTAYGYAYIEGLSLKGQQGMVARLSVYDGNMVREDPVLPQSEYELAYASNKLNFYYDKFRAIARQRRDGEELGSFDYFIFSGGWAEQFLGGFGDAGGSVAWCEPRPTDIGVITANSILRP